MPSSESVKEFESTLHKFFNEMRIPIIKFGRENISYTIEANARLLKVFVDVVDIIDSVAVQWRYAMSIRFREFMTGKREVPEETVRRMFNAVLTNNEFFSMIHNLVAEYHSYAGFHNTLNQTADKLIELYGSASDEEKQEMLSDLLSYSLEAVEVLFIFIVATLLKTLPQNEAACTRDSLITLLRTAIERKETVPFTEIANYLSRTKYFGLASGALEHAYAELVALANERFEFYKNMVNALSKMRSLGECRPSASIQFSTR